MHKRVVSFTGFEMLFSFLGGLKIVLMTCFFIREFIVNCVLHIEVTGCWKEESNKSTKMCQQNRYNRSEINRAFKNLFVNLTPTDKSKQDHSKFRKSLD